MRRLFVLFLLASAMSAMFATPTPVSACSCVMRQGTAEQWLTGSSAIFAGTVTDVSIYGYRRDVELDVSQSWKGYLDEVSVFTGQGGGDCGYDFEVGEEYLVFAYGDDQLETSICTGTSLLADAQSDVDALNAVTGGYMSPQNDVETDEAVFEASKASTESNVPTIVVAVTAFGAGVLVAYGALHRKG